AWQLQWMKGTWTSDEYVMNPPMRASIRVLNKTNKERIFISLFLISVLDKRRMKATWNAITRQGNDSGKACDVFGFNLLARDMTSPSSTNISDFANKFDLGLSFILGLVVMTCADLVGLS
nr:hypothetical protein [Tanacetum cinerariifolium]GFB45824.1 hypothetical protein [Tanacetum cinerariifolium]